MSTYETRLRLLGMEVLTDHAPLADMLNARIEEPGDERRDAIFSLAFGSRFPGFMDAVVAGHQELGAKRLRPTLVTYFNFRVQVWALGFDSDPSMPRRCLPTGIVDESAYSEPTVH